MGIFSLKYLNPVFVYRNREKIPVYIRNYSRDLWAEAVHLSLRARGFAAEHGFGLTANDRRFASFHNRHSGQRAFIIGTGPSLTIADLERLRGEITFGSNQIYVAFKETDWRPTYYMTPYLDCREGYYASIEQFTGSIKFIPIAARKVYPITGAVYYRRVHKWFYPNLPQFSYDAFEHVYWGGTVTYELIQLAYYMGIKEIYLIGVDFSYYQPEAEGLKPGDAYVSRGDRSHFHPDYTKPGEIDFVAVTHLHAKAYEAAKIAMERVGGRIFNATRGGKLEIFPRVNFDDIVS